MRTRQGSVFIMALFVVTIISTLLMALLTRNAGEQLLARRGAQHEQAMGLAEAGIDRALAVLKLSSLTWNDELLGPDGLPGMPPGTGDDGQLSFGPGGSLDLGTYTVRVMDNADEVAPLENDPLSDSDGLIRVESTGTVQDSRRRVVMTIWALFNHAVAAELDIVLREASLLGSLHANQDWTFAKWLYVSCST